MVVHRTHEKISLNMHGYTKAFQSCRPSTRMSFQASTLSLITNPVMFHQPVVSAHSPFAHHPWHECMRFLDGHAVALLLWWDSESCQLYFCNLRFTLVKCKMGPVADKLALVCDICWYYMYMHAFMYTCVQLCVFWLDVVGLVTSAGIMHTCMHLCGVISWYCALIIACMCVFTWLCVCCCLVCLCGYVFVVAWFAGAAEVTFARKYVCTNIVIYVLLYAYIIMLMHVHTHILANTHRAWEFWGHAMTDGQQEDLCPRNTC